MIQPGVLLARLFSQASGAPWSLKSPCQESVALAVLPLSCEAASGGQPALSASMCPAFLRNA
ncbi:hypothetical protein E2C01_025435 [Portunus trituberculatus]|uniref:Uncharacterized protein n=1 Tax=Portunus trituberculatus TaxID=210409 RepID=A0A5B7ECX5_PORTR|nr:hypothetical protein [Portunus trituberculatus]